MLIPFSSSGMPTGPAYFILVILDYSKVSNGLSPILRQPALADCYLRINCT
jgi:hypothetical protein